MNGYQSYYYVYENKYEIRKNFFSNLYDFQLENGISGYNYEYKFPTIIKDGEYIKLSGNCFILNPNNGDLNLITSCERRDLIQDKLKTQAYIDIY